MDLSGKNVVYFGGFGGIGQKCVQELLQRKIKSLAIFDLTENSQVLAEWKSNNPDTDIFYQKVDITQKSDIEAAYKATAEKLGHFDVVVNGSGLMNDRLIELTIQINLLGVVYSCLTALEYMDKTKGGHGGVIVNISSVAGLQPTSSMAIYSAAKTGVTTFTRALAHPSYYARSGVGFITVCPGFTDTGLLDDILNKTTFEYQPPMMAGKVKKQTAEQCARSLVGAIETGKNGAVLLLELGETHEVDIPSHWKPQFED
ncbi:alcohol dehydrogenase-like [Drosophila kikkawai]|uniref:Fat body protein 2 n=1 Tax=Drosophila kikkawai TaxID=30033 RepID=A0A6P4IF27_DROKI|nr:alcohol dehydrogenase-like [Drosophila kikkawai]